MTIKFNHTEEISMMLLQREETIAVAESVTAGLLQFGISSAENAQHYFQGGITTYNLGQKYKHLNVEPVHAMKANCVSAQVAGQMALYVSKLFSSDWGIAITGYSTPVADSGNRLYAYYAIAYHEKIVKHSRIDIEIADPEEVKYLYVQRVLRDMQLELTEQTH